MISIKNNLSFVKRLVDDTFISLGFNPKLDYYQFGLREGKETLVADCVDSFDTDKIISLSCESDDFDELMQKILELKKKK